MGRDRAVRAQHWLVIIPPLCAVLIVAKLIVLGIFAINIGATSGSFAGWIRTFIDNNISINEGLLLFTTLFFSAALLIVGLRFLLKNLPTYYDEDYYRKENNPLSMVRQRDETEKLTLGVDDGGFGWRIVLPVGLAALLITAVAAAQFDKLLTLSLWKVAIGTAIIYGLSWLVALPWASNAEPKPNKKSRLVRFEELVAWAGSGAVFGAVILLGIEGLNSLPHPNEKLMVLSVVGPAWIIAALNIGVVFFVGLPGKQARSDQDREWFARSSGWFAAISIAWIALVSLVVLGPTLVEPLKEVDWPELAAWVGSSGVISAVLGHSSATKARDGEKGWLALSLELVLAVTVPIFLASLIISLSAGLDWLLIGRLLFNSKKVKNEYYLDVTGVLETRTWEHLIIGGMIAAVIGVIASRFVNINWFSLHALYRNRLIRAFLGASNPERLPNPFTGFDQKDNPQVVELWPADPGSDQESATSVGEHCPVKNGCGRPFHLINIAINFVSTKRLVWQERKAASFTISPLHSGWACDEKPRFRLTRDYGHCVGPKQQGDRSKEGISLGTAMAISGAAASPNMGYHSSPIVTLVLALFNVRLGWWLGNPGEPGEKTFWGLSGYERKIHAYQMESPKWAIKPFIAEMFGKTSEERPFVYLSDGGHFENLGLYEMVRRRCKYIVVSDASCDPQFAFEDLGNAVRKIWIDLGVKVTFYRIHTLRSRMEEDQRERRSGSGTRPSAQDDDSPLFAIGRIDYDQGDPSRFGYILYVKAAYNRSALRNIGVRSYAMAHPAFPHESTIDQFFSESQFESYRALGFEIMDDILLDGLKKVWSGAPMTLGAMIESLSKDIIKSYEADTMPVPQSSGT